MTCTIEYHPVDPGLVATIESELQDPFGNPPPTIIHDDDALRVVVKVTLSGPLVENLAGELFVKVGVESVGLGSEADFGPQSKLLEPCGNGVYTFTFDIAANTLQATKPGTRYLTAVTMGIYTLCGGPGPVEGSCDGLSFSVHTR